jgi:hypothetical protein
MLAQEDRIRLIHENRTALLNRMFDDRARRLQGNPAFGARCVRTYPPAGRRLFVRLSASSVHP